MMISNIIKAAFSKNQKTPLDLIVHVTSKCNAKCQTCFVWEDLNSGKKDLTLNEYEIISKQLPKLLWLSISGGEPFLRKDLPEICEVFYKNSRMALLGIPTNALLPRKVYSSCSRLLKRIPIPVIIDISIDGLDERHDQLRGVEGNFKKAIETYRALVSLKKEFPHLAIKIITVINNKNYDQLEDINQFVRSEMPDVNYHSYIFLRGSSPCKDIALPSLQDLEKKKEFLLQRSHSYYGDQGVSWIERKLALMARRYLLDVNLETLRKKDQVIPCLAGKYHGIISADGDVSLCEMMHKIGNLRDCNLDFSSLWHSEKANRLRRSIEQKECFCTHECAQMVNIVLNYKNYRSLIKVFCKEMFRFRNR